ncbi:MAG: GTP-binding protein [Spirochaetaceae bacterium]|nr:MAG: GTP-binding protein [Spirochaetaceae bacterium]
MKRIPITLVTGFLGSGKSTFINRVVENFPGRRFGLIVNEFGDVQLESNIVKASEERIVELSNGCMCCVIRGDLLSTVDRLLRRQPDIDHIILEASGLSDPVPIANTFLNADLNGTIRFDAIVCLFDVENYERNFRDYSVSHVQLEYADFIVLTKTDAADADRAQAAREFLSTIDTEARIFTVDEALDPDVVIDTFTGDHADIRDLEIADHNHAHGDQDTHDGHEHDHAHGDTDTHDHHDHAGYHHAHEDVETLFFRTDRPLYADHFGYVFQHMPEGVVRAKGFLDLADEEAEDAKYILQYTGARKDLYSVDWKPGEKRQSALVFIGKNFDAAALQRRLEACHAPL